MLATMFLIAQAVAEDSVLFLDVQMLNFAVGVIVPLLVGLLSKINAPGSLKAVLNLALSAIGGAITTVIAAEGAVEIQEFVVGIGMTWLTSIVSYYGFWKPTHVADSVQSATPRLGIGPSRTS